MYKSLKITPTSCKRYCVDTNSTWAFRSKKYLRLNTSCIFFVTLLRLGRDSSILQLALNRELRKLDGKIF